MNKELINELIRDIQARLDTIRGEVNERDKITTVQELEAAINKRGLIELDTKEFPLNLPTRIFGNTTIVGNEAKITSLLYVNEADNDILLKEFTLVAPQKARSLLRLGNNVDGAQTVNNLPFNITLDHLMIPTHRGRSAIEVNSDRTSLLNCTIMDVYDPDGTDSQAVVIQNTPGNFLLDGGYFEAASENLLVGGDTLRLETTRKNIIIRNATFSKKMSWKGVVPTKNIIELKDGSDVEIDNCELNNCWLSGQGGYAFMFTPTMGGQLVDVLVKNCTVRNVTGCFNIAGRDINKLNFTRTRVTISGGKYDMNQLEMGGKSRFCLVARGPEEIIIDNVEVTANGDYSQFLYVGDSEPIDRVYITNSKWPYGTYGISIGPKHHGDNSLGIIKSLVIKGNTISGAPSSFRGRYPENTYV